MSGYRGIHAIPLEYLALHILTMEWRALYACLMREAIEAEPNHHHLRSHPAMSDPCRVCQVARQ